MNMLVFYENLFFFCRDGAWTDQRGYESIEIKEQSQERTDYYLCRTKGRAHDEIIGYAVGWDQPIVIGPYGVCLFSAKDPSLLFPEDSEKYIGILFQEWVKAIAEDCEKISNSFNDEEDLFTFSSKMKSDFFQWSEYFLGFDGGVHSEMYMYTDWLVYLYPIISENRRKELKEELMISTSELNKRLTEFSEYLNGMDIDAVSTEVRKEESEIVTDTKKLFQGFFNGTFHVADEEYEAFIQRKRPDG